MIEDILQTAEQRMQKAIDHAKHELATIRTGRATVSLLDSVKVDYYGTPTPVNAVANITTPDPRLVVVQPWDKSMLAVLEKAIQKSELGINPTNDGQVLRLALPRPTEERRRELVKQVHQRAEEARVAVRNIRRDGMDQLKKLEHVTKEEGQRGQERLEKTTAQHIQQIEEALKRKEAEVMEV